MLSFGLMKSNEPFSGYQAVPEVVYSTAKTFFEIEQSNNVCTCFVISRRGKPLLIAASIALDWFQAQKTFTGKKLFTGSQAQNQ